jgi:hypothetical protein
MRLLDQAVGGAFPRTSVGHVRRKFWYTFLGGGYLGKLK